MGKHSSGGFTLVELMVTVAVAATLAGIALPSMRALVQGMQLRTATNELAVALAYARAEAVKRGVPITLCKSLTADAAAPSCDAQASWSDGWLVFVNDDANGDLSPAGPSAGQVLKNHAPGASGLHIQGGSNFAHHLSYLPNGVSRGSGALANGSFALCLAGQLRRVSVNSTGRVSVARGSC